MLIRNILISSMVLLAVAAGAAVVSAQDGWRKIGEKDVNFNVDHDTISASDKGKIKEIRFSVRNAPIKFRKVVVNYKDGTKQELEFLEDVKLDQDTRSITIEGDGHVISSVDVWYETDSLGGKKAKITAYGR